MFLHAASQYFELPLACAQIRDILGPGKQINTKKKHTWSCCVEAGHTLSHGCGIPIKAGRMACVCKAAPGQVGHQPATHGPLTVVFNVTIKIIKTRESLVAFIY